MTLHPHSEEMTELIQRLLVLEDVVNYREPPTAGELPFRYQEGTHPVLISAPHAASHMRGGELKVEDEYTAAFARLIAEKTGAHALFLTRRSEEDPNWDQHALYKATLAEIYRQAGIRFVLDLHGMGNRYKVGLAVGSRHGRACPDQLPSLRQTLQVHSFREVSLEESMTFVELEGDTYLIDHPKFTGGVTSHTVTRFVNEALQIPAVQIEISSTMRIVKRAAHGPWPSTFYGSWRGIEMVARALIDFVSRI